MACASSPTSDQVHGRSTSNVVCRRIGRGVVKPCGKWGGEALNFLRAFAAKTLTRINLMVWAADDTLNFIIV